MKTVLGEPRVHLRGSSTPVLKNNIIIDALKIIKRKAFFYVGHPSPMVAQLTGKRDLMARFLPQDKVNSK